MLYCQCMWCTAGSPLERLVFSKGAFEDLSYEPIFYALSLGVLVCRGSLGSGRLGQKGGGGVDGDWPTTPSPHHWSAGAWL